MSYANVFLNYIKCSSIPNHKLRLKNDVYNANEKIDQSVRLCNRTKVAVSDLASIRETIIPGITTSNIILITRIYMVQSDPVLENNFV
jgi:hypothetical protein